jgi:hypothetical protein
MHIRSRAAWGSGMIEPPTPVAFLELAPHHCRWPIGHPKTPGFGFCGRTKIDGSSYCREHAERAVERGGRGRENARPALPPTIPSELT